MKRRGNRAGHGWRANLLVGALVGAALIINLPLLNRAAVWALEVFRD